MEDREKPEKESIRKRLLFRYLKSLSKAVI